MSELSPLRKGRITGSRVSTILGLNKYQSRGDCLRDMVREALGADPEFKGNVATEFGQAHEGDALTLLERRDGLMLHSCQELFIHPVHDFLAVTVDALRGDDEVVEAKAPWRAVYSHIDERPDYAVQVKLQIECTGRKRGIFVVWRDADIATSVVEHDPTWLPSVLPELEEFHAEYLAIVADPDLSASFLAPKKRRRAA